MATADELLMTTSVSDETTTESTEEILTVDLNTRVISIPTTIKILGVESDDDVKRLQFKVPRYYGEFDLSTFDVRINFKNARSNGDVYPVKDLETVDTDHITFSWLVDRTAFNYAGDVKFSICMKLYDDTGIVIKELNTTYATLPVLEGLETERAVVDQNPSAFDHVMTRLYAVEAATGNGRNGYYSVVRAMQTEDGVLFTIINQDGETVAYVRHGYDGRTPVRGVDYWTEDDKTEVETAAAEYATGYVDTWAPQTISVDLPVSGWSNNQQRVNVPGVSATNIIIVSSDQNYTKYKEYASCCVRCVAQENNALTFECERKPSIDLKANIAVYYSTAASGTLSNFSVTDDGEGNVVIM